jgi:hypothetical protein
VTLEQHTGDNFRFYRYDPEDGSEPVDLLSVTSIRTLCGESYNLVNWKMANLADAALGTMKRTVIGPRGGVSEKRQVWEYPSEFARQYEATQGDQSKVDALRKWLRDQADEPRNIAGVRGTIVHEAIEKNIAWDRIERPYVESAFANMTDRDRKKVKRAVNDEDIAFVRNSVRQYADMRNTVPMVLISREVRVVNLQAGYAGTFDALVWMLPPGYDVNARDGGAMAGPITLADIKRMGGYLALLDWKTAKDIHTDYVAQVHGYLAAEFAVVNGRRDERITEMLLAAQRGGLVHIRPNGWALYEFPYSDEGAYAFFGSVAFARYLAKYKYPTAIWDSTLKGVSQEVDD